MLKFLKGVGKFVSLGFTHADERRPEGEWFLTRMQPNVSQLNEFFALLGFCNASIINDFLQFTQISVIERAEDEVSAAFANGSMLKPLFGHLRGMIGALGVDEPTAEFLF